jgi:hypothetical protein
MADESELANLKALVKRLTCENELLRKNQHSHSEESWADGPMTHSGNNDAEPAATKSNDRPPAAASTEARTRAELLMEALHSVLENAPASLFYPTNQERGYRTSKEMEYRGEGYRS